MNCWALLAVKHPSQGKQRLAAVLSPRQRRLLVRAMLHRMLEVLLESRQLRGIAIVTPDARALGLIASDRLRLIDDPGGGLNEALTFAARQLERDGADELLVLHADMPRVSATEIDQFITRGRQEGLLLASDARRLGSNALYLPLPVDFTFHFGTDSLKQHLNEAKRKNLSIAVTNLPGLTLDIDEPADLDLLPGGLLFEEFRRKTAMTSSKTPLFSELLEGRTLSDRQALALAELDATPELFETARALTLRGHGRRVSYSRKVFIPLTRLCRNTCGYCTFATSPKRVPSPYLSADEVLDIARKGAEAGCQEALFTLGEKPELRYAAAREALAEMGYRSTLEYVAAMAERVHKETGLLPHINPGNMDSEEVRMLKPFAASMGIMLESVSARLCERGGPHFNCPDKHPEVRMQTLRNAGEAQVAMTTGILIGIGETRKERIESLLALRDLHARYGHLQEIIIQNFRAKPNTPMAGKPEPDLEDHGWTIAMARLIFGPQMSIQAPPNLRPGELEALIDAGINDWGGISPVTPDHVNPEAAWPHISFLAKQTKHCGRNLVERLALTPAFTQSTARWTGKEMARAILNRVDASGFARRDKWRAGTSMAPDEDLARLLRSGPTARASADVQRILDKAQAKLDLDEAEIVALFAVDDNDFAALTDAANLLRREVVGDDVTFVQNCNINYTNICQFRCGFCAFAKSQGAASLRGPAYQLDPAQVAERAVEAWQRGASEVCMQGGIHPHYTGHSYLAFTRAVKAAVPQMHIHAFSPLEVIHGATTLGLSLDDYIRQLRDAGLNTLPGTAAEILDDEVRAIICPDKLDTEEWLRVMRTAHAAGIRSTATMMFGHVEKPLHWARHLIRIRDLQKETGGFTEFVPLPFVHMESPLWHKGLARSGPTLRESILVHAVSRLALHGHIRNIQTSWVKMGREGAALCLQAGANDLGGVLMYESITRAAGGANGQLMASAEMSAIAQSSGRPLQLRNTLYQPIAPSAERQPATPVQLLAKSAG